MAEEIQELAKLLGAQVVGRVPDVGGGAFGAARLARVYQERVEKLRAQSPDGASNISRTERAEIPVSETTLRTLTQLATLASTPERRVSPAQVAAQLLEEAVAKYQVAD